MDMIGSETLDRIVQSDRRSTPTTISDLVERALLLERRGLCGHEQRDTDRYPFTRLIELTPYDTVADGPTGERITVPCRNLSLTGMGFYHSNALASRFATVQLLPDSDEPELLIRLVWCRFLKPGWYDNGGRFVRVAPTQ